MKQIRVRPVACVPFVALNSAIMPLHPRRLQTHPWPSPVLVDEFDAGSLKRVSQDHAAFPARRLDKAPMSRPAGDHKKRRFPA